MTKPITGYAEGFYGRLLSWNERRQILDTLQRLGQTSYYYAPKEDPCHRLHWRTPYSTLWRQEFKAFCTQARQQGIQVIAGVAPGLDFDFSNLPDGNDFHSLVGKCRLLLEDGAEVISLLMDDIDADFEMRSGQFNQEGQAHAALANALGKELSKDTVAGGQQAQPLWVTPRIYADELIESAPEYLPTFLRTLHPVHPVLYCGSDVVAHTIDDSAFDALRAASESGELKHHIIIWDNLYANDYCPRRLFVGAWQRRQSLCDVLLNPTGMVHTDCLLLELMAESMQATGDGDECMDVQVWQKVLLTHGVPEEFLVLAPFFNHPVFNGCHIIEPCANSQTIKDAIEHCLWRWKTPLSREWYPAIFGLKHDLLTLAGEHSPLRIRKTQNAPLAEVLQQQIEQKR